MGLHCQVRRQGQRPDGNTVVESGQSYFISMTVVNAYYHVLWEDGSHMGGWEDGSHIFPLHMPISVCSRANSGRGALLFVAITAHLAWPPMLLFGLLANC
jgi:hypothetical protein